MSFKIKLDQIIRYYDLSPADLGERLGYGRNPAKLYRLLNDETKNPSIHIIKNILSAYPDLNARWLLFEDETMILEEPLVKYGKCKECTEKDIIIKFLKSECAEKDKQIQELISKGNISPGDAVSQTSDKKKAS